MEAVVVEAGGAQAAFGRNYFALRPVTPAGPGATPSAAPPADPAAAPASTPAATTPGGN